MSSSATPQIPDAGIPAAVLLPVTGGASSPQTATRLAAPPSQASSRFVFQAPAPRPPPSPPPPAKRNAPDPGLAALDRAIAPILRRAWNRCDVDDIRGNAVLAYCEARNRRQDTASSIKAGVQAADRARRPPGARSREVRFISDSLPAVAREAINASATPPDEGNSMGVFAKLPEVPRRVAYAVIVLGSTINEAAEALEMTPHKVRRQLARAKKLAAEIMTEEPGTKRKGRVLKPW